MIILLQNDADYTESMQVSWVQSVAVQACVYSHPDLMRSTKVDTKTRRKRKTESKP